MDLEFKSLPKDLKIMGKFCIWRIEKKGRLPYNPLTSEYAKCNDSSSFTDFNTTKAALVFESDYTKVGLGLGLFNGFSAININNCVNSKGIVNDYALDIINYCKSYTELSPSKKGITIIVKSQTIIQNLNNYNTDGKLSSIFISGNTNKYVTLTADEIYPNNINEVDLQYVLDKYFSKGEINNAKTHTLVVNKYDETDTGNARLFVDKYRGNIRYNYENKSWMLWNGKYWQYDYTHKIKTLVEVLVDDMKQQALKTQNKDQLAHAKRSANHSGKVNLLTESQHLEGVAVLNSDLNKNKILFNCQNGTVNLKSGELYPHTREDLISKYSNVVYTPNAEPTKWLQFLEDIIGDFDDKGNWQPDGAKINYLQKVMGYSLTGLTNEQCMFFFLGDGSNGKSVLADIHQNILGEYATVADKDLLVDRKMQTSNASQVARLDKKRCCYVSETEQNDRLKESAVKQMTGGTDKLIGKFLYANEFEFTPEFKIYMMSNYEPNIVGTDDGIWRRLVLLKFNRKFNDNEKDINLTDKLMQERDAIFTWFVEGAMLVLKEGLGKPDFVKAEVDKYRYDMDILEKWIEDRCNRVVGSFTNTSKLYSSYKLWCDDTNEYPLKQISFSKQLAKKFDKRRINAGVNFYGIELKHLGNSIYD